MRAAYAVDSPLGRHLLPGWSARVVHCTVNSITAALSPPPPQPAAAGVNRRGNASHTGCVGPIFVVCCTLLASVPVS